MTSPKSSTKTSSDPKSVRNLATFLTVTVSQASDSPFLKVSLARSINAIAMALKREIEVSSQYLAFPFPVPGLVLR